MKKIICSLIAFLLLMNTSFALSIEPSSWAKSDVEELKSYSHFDTNIFKDYSKNITRGQFIYLAVRLYELFDGKEITPDPLLSFTDTDSIFALKGATVGIAKGIGNNKFGYSELVTREQLTTMMINILKLGKIDLNISSKTLFTDDNAISSWAKENVYLAHSNSIIQGVGNNKFSPKGNATIEQALIITNNLIKSNIGNAWTSPNSLKTHLITIPTNNSNKTVEAKDIEIGDYIEFGNYRKAKILWQVINFDGNGDPLLWSDNILAYTCFDAAESGKGYVSNAGWDFINGGPITPDESIEAYGSNFWRNSNIREWLQSRDKSVNYTTQAPIGSAVAYYKDANMGFENEPGFLYDFSEDDISLIKSVKNKTTISSHFLEHMDGGTEPKIQDFAELSNGISNEDTAYYDVTEDNVFLLSSKEIIEYVIGNNLDFQKYFLDQAIDYPELASIKDFLIGHNKQLLFRSLRPFDDYSDSIIEEFLADKHVYLYHEYFTRSPLSDLNFNISSVFRVNPYTGHVGTYLIGSSNANQQNGVVPALYIKLQQTMVLKGDGSHSSPYVIGYKK